MLVLILEDQEIARVEAAGVEVVTNEGGLTGLQNLQCISGACGFPSGIGDA